LIASASRRTARPLGFYLIGTEQEWQFGVVPFIVPDIVKAGRAASLIPPFWALFARR